MTGKRLSPEIMKDGPTTRSRFGPDRSGEGVGDYDETKNFK